METNRFILRKQNHSHFEKKERTLLTDNEQLYRTLFLEAIDAIVFWDREGRILLANNAALKIFECTIEEFTKKKLFDFVYLENERTCRLLDRLKQMEAVRDELLFRMPNGQLKHLEFTSKYMSKEKYHMTIFRNISDRYQMEQTLRDSEERFRKVFEGSFDGMVLWSGDLKILDINPVAARYFDFERDFIIGKSLQVLLHTNDEKIEKAFYSHLRRLKENGVADFFFSISKPNVTRYFEITSKGNLASNLNLTVIRDVTERRALQEQLRKSDTLNIVGELAAGIAHEIRNPMTALKGFIQLLQNSMKEEDHSLYFNVITSELARIESIITEFLVLAKPQATQFQYHDIRKIMSDTIDLLNAQALMHNIQISCFFDEGLPDVYCEGNQIKQVFINVIKNAIEVMPNGGNIVITIRDEAGDGMIHTSIKDEGEGIPEDKIEKLGEPFYTTKERGTGLGLMVSYKIT
ncbi:PAS domain-containing sensor histidine kinase [Heyndrickxia acidiproducens]|uniref:PAS domain-containing sensor histidine kinase n=1 Tax=Heyndrickxia acidiproducens TaxID=1121084 RepID=UPI00035FB6E3|nr:PAS domain S-box protein [Heyndrickxia acidiproducens]